MCRLKDARKGHLQPAAIQSSLQGVTEYAGGINMTSGYIQVVVMFGSIFFWPNKWIGQPITSPKTSRSVGI